MNHKTLMGSAVAAALLATSLSANAGSIADASIPASAAENTATAWFVQFKSKPGNSSNHKKAMAAERKAFREAAKSAGIQYSERRSFGQLWNGISIDAANASARQLKSLGGVAAVFPVVKVAQAEPHTLSRPDLLSALEMTGADIAQSELGLTGQGVKVGVIDSGIDIDHPDLGGNGNPDDHGAAFPTTRIAYGWDFVGDDYNADPTDPAYNPEPSPDPIPDDCGGHGTHVAGIVGASGGEAGVTGVAPQVTLGAYRVFGCGGSTDSDIIIEAMEQAHADGMDIVNMSLGASFTWPQYPTAVAADALVENGVVVVASIGNSGATGLYSAGSPGLGDLVIGTGSIDNAFSLSAYFEVEGSKVAYLPMTHSGPIPTTGMEDYVYIGRACLDNGEDVDGDDPLLADPTGITALITRGACSFNEKAQRAIDAGASAVIIHNSGSGNFGGTLGEPIDGTTPVVSVSGENGAYMKSVAEENQKLAWTDQSFLDPSPTGGLVSDFSSYGLSPDLTLKPDISAPGGAIYSTYPLEEGGYATLGGTSMSSPHVAGAAALVLEARGSVPAMEMRTILQNSADPVGLALAPWFGLEPVHHQGAGMVDIDASALATVMATPGKLSLGEGETEYQVHEITLHNDGDDDVTYDVYDEQALSTSGLTDDIWWWGSSAGIIFSHNQVTVPAGGTASVSAMIYPAWYPDPDLGEPLFYPTDFGIYGGYIQFLPTGDGGEALRVPYAGFVGDYQRIQHIGPGAIPDLELPVLAAVDDGYYTDGAEGEWVFTMQDGNIAHFLMHFDHQLEYMDAVVYNADTGKVAHPNYYITGMDQYLPRNPTADGFFDIPWDGTHMHSSGSNGKGNTKMQRRSLPNGRYFLEFRGLKANGDRDNVDHWETWTSPVLVIDRRKSKSKNG